MNNYIMNNRVPKIIQKTQKRDRRIFSFKHIIKNLDSVPNKKLNFFSNVWFQHYGELIYQDFSPMFHFRKNYFGTRHKIQM